LQNSNWNCAVVLSIIVILVNSSVTARDVVLAETSSENPILQFRDEDSKLKMCGLCRCFSKNFPKYVITTSKLKLFPISGIFPTCFGCVLSANTADKSTLIYKVSLSQIVAVFKVSMQ